MILGWKAKQEINPLHWEGGGDLPSTNAPGGVESGSVSSDPLAHAQSIFGGAVPTGVSSSSTVEARAAPPSTPPVFGSLQNLDGGTLLEIISSVDQMVMTGIAGAKETALPAEVILAAIEIPPKDLKKLEKLAPYAASYAPIVEQYARPILACVFVGFWGLSMALRAKNLDRLERRYLEGSNGIGSVSPN
jgi:hypothetical protein